MHCIIGGRILVWACRRAFSGNEKMSACRADGCGGKAINLLGCEPFPFARHCEARLRPWQSPEGMYWCPVAVPDKIFGLTLILDFVDRGHSLGSLHLPPAALPSLPRLDLHFLPLAEN